MSPSTAHAYASELRTVDSALLVVGRLWPGLGIRLAHRLAARRARRWEHVRDPEAVPLAVHGPESDAIAAKAHVLAVAGREDPAAVVELRALAGRDRRALGEADAMARVGAKHRESAIGDRHHRLLVTALEGRDVAPPNPADLARFNAVAELHALPRDRQWERLTELEPRFISLEAANRSGSSVRSDGHSVRALGAREARRRARDDARRWYQLMAQVGAILGPASGTDDPLLGSRAARDVAAYRLEHIELS
jgi:hypothetical protein